MSKKRKELGPDSHWHFDCRLEAELPEDNVIGSRFLVTVMFGSVALMFVLLSGWLAYRDINLHSEIRDWETRIKEDELQVREVRQEQGQYTIEANKIDQAFATVRSPLFVTGFLANIARSRPREMIIREIETDTTTVYVRGTVYETYDKAYKIFKEYIQKLEADKELAPLFEAIKQGGLDQAPGATNRANFELKFIKKAGG